MFLLNIFNSTQLKTNRTYRGLQTSAWSLSLNYVGKIALSCWNFSLYEGDFKRSAQSLLYWRKLFILQNPLTGLQYNPHSSLWQLPNVLANPVFRIKYLHCWAVWSLGSLQWKLLELWLWLHFRLAEKLLHRYQTEGEEFLKRTVVLDDTRFWAWTEVTVTAEEASTEVTRVIWQLNSEGVLSGIQDLPKRWEAVIRIL